MMLLAILAATSSVEAPPAPRVDSVAQAKATVRIVAGAWVTAQQIPQEALIRETEVEAPNGSRSTARLVEFP